MPENTKAISSPEATGGAGTFFEQHVNAFWLSLLLVRGIPPIIKETTVHEVFFQTEHLGWHTDDCLIVAKTDSGEQKRLVCQVKKTFTVSLSSNECRKAILDFWRDFKSPQFDRANDKLVLIVSKGSNNLLADFVGLFELARSVRSERDFLDILVQKGFVNSTVKKYGTIIRTIIGEDEEEINDCIFWQFLRTIFLVTFDLNTSTRHSEAQILSLLAYTVKDGPSLDVAKTTWSSLLSLVSDGTHGMPKAGSFKFADLPENLRNIHGSIETKEKRILQSVSDHTKFIENKIKDNLNSSLHLERCNIVHNVITGIEQSNFLILSGGAGVGKSAISKKILNLLSQSYFTLAFRAEEFACAHLDQTLLNAQLNVNSANLMSILSSQDKVLILIESVERLLEKTTRDAFSDLISLVSEKSNLKLIMTCRDYSTKIFGDAFFLSRGIQHSTISITGFDDQELATVAKVFPELAIPLLSAPLRKLLKIPYVLDKALLINWAGEQSLPRNEKEFRTLFWGHIVKDEALCINALPQKRAETFIAISIKRAKALAPYVSCPDLDQGVINALQRDSLISADNNSLFAPAHDVLEDWALLEWLDVRYSINSGELLSFSADIGGFPALRRCYRKWITELAEINPNQADQIFQSILTTGGLSSQFVDDSLVSLLRAGDSVVFLNRNKNKILSDDFSILKNIIHLLRVACVNTPKWLAHLSAVGLATVPDGAAWPAVLEFVWQNIDTISVNHKLLLTNLVEDFAKSVSWEIPYPPGHQAAAGIAYKLLAETDEHYSTKESRKRLLTVIAKLPNSYPDKFILLVQNKEDSERGSNADLLCNILFQTFDGMPASRDFPELICTEAKECFLYTDEDLRQDRRDPYYYSYDEEAFWGIKRTEDFSKIIESPLDVPFFTQLLCTNPEKGKEFIANIVNHSTEWLANPRLKDHFDHVIEMELVLPDGTPKKQWASHTLWCLYRGTPTGPSVLKALLMALEDWLLKEAELKPSEFDELLLSFLKLSNSAAITAVVASAAMANPLLAKETLIVLLSSPECILYDRSRWAEDRIHSPSSFVKNFPFLNAQNQIKLQERLVSDALAFRQDGLELAILNIQLTDAAERIYAILDDYYNDLDSDEELGFDKTSWSLCLHRMDLRKFKISNEVPGETKKEYEGVVFFTPHVEDKVLLEKSSESEQRLQKTNELASLSLWAYSVFRFENPSTYSPKDWKEKLIQVKAIPDAEYENESVLTRGAKEYIAAVCIRDHWSELDDNDTSWCIGSVCLSIEQTCHAWNDTIQFQQFDREGNRAAAWALPLLMTKKLRENTYQRIKKNFLLALVHPSKEVRRYIYASIANNLWEHDRNLVILVVNALAYEAIQIEGMRDCERKKEYANRLQGFEIDFKAAQAIIKTFYADEVPQDSFKRLNINTWAGTSAYAAISLILSRSPNEDLAVYCFQRIGDVLGHWWDGDRHTLKTPRTNRNLNHDQELQTNLQYFLLHTPSKEAVYRAITPLVEITNRHSREVRDFILGLISEEDRSYHPERFWEIWNLFANRILALVASGHLGDHELDELLLAMFLGTFWKKDTMGWRTLEGYEDNIHGFFDSLPPSGAALDSYLMFFEKVGATYLPMPFIRIAEKLKADTPENILNNVNSKFLLENYLCRYVYGAPAVLKTNQALRDSVIFLLDTLVALGSSVAFLMRDDFVTPLSVA